MIGEIIGQEISVNVPKNMKAQVIPQGNSYQSTREGYNIFNYLPRISCAGNLNCVTDENTGYITINGTPSWDYSTCVSSFNIDDILEDGETYSVWQEVYSNKVNGGMYIQLQIKPKDGKASQWINSSIGKLNFTVDKTKYSYNIMIQCGTISDAGTFNNYKNRYMIYKGTDDKPFELYGASPSLDYPSEVEAVGDNINLFDKDTMPLRNGLWSGNNVVVSNTYGWYVIIPIIGGEVYTISKKYNGNDFSYICLGYATTSEYPQSNTPTVDDFTFNNKSNSMTFQTSKEAKYLFVTLAAGSTTDITSEKQAQAIEELKVEKGTVATPYSQYGQGNIEIIHQNKNMLSNLPATQTINGVTFTNNEDGTYTVNGTATSVAYIVLKTLTLEDIDYSISGCPQGGSNETYSQYIFIPSTGGGLANDFGKGATFRNSNKPTVEVRLRIASGYKANNLIFRPQLEKGAATNFVENEVNTYTIPIQKPFYKIGDYVDNFIKQNNKWYEQHYIKELILTGEEEWSQSSLKNNRFAFKLTDNVITDDSKILAMSNYFVGTSYNQLQQSNLVNVISLNDGNIAIDTDNITDIETFKAKVKELYDSGNPIKVYYILATPELIECTEEQTQVLEQLSNLYLYEGINYLYSTDDLSPIFQFSYNKIVNDFKFYLSENGRLIFPNENISFLCSISESSIPSMPEALETSATIAGRDGDVPLSTTYGPMSFELVLYTEDNLTPEEKLKQEIFLNRFCNSIKNNTETFALELAQKFYKIKYNGLLNKENYPKFLKFTLPFKSSKSFAYDVKKNTAYGNNTFESNTIEPTGFECVIKGPAIKPIISLNDYSIEYNNTILDDESLIIDTNNSTAVLVNSEGTRVNAMRYYNHQFPKILNGENELKILSGIDNPENVSISWYDLTL